MHPLFAAFVLGIVAGMRAFTAPAFIGAYGGRAARLWAIEKIGPIAAGLAESAIAILVAAFVVTHL